MTFRSHHLRYKNRVVGAKTMFILSPQQRWSKAHRKYNVYCSPRCVAGAARTRSYPRGAAVSNYKHGHSVGKCPSPTFRTWLSMRQRCLNAANPSYPDYGERGIRLCQRWQDSFESFLADMGERPSGHSIERIDTNGNYEPSNCRWATPKEQSNNRRAYKGGITFEGKTQTIRAWAVEMKITEDALTYRLKAGWDIHKALTTQVRRRLALGSRAPLHVYQGKQGTVAALARFYGMPPPTVRERLQRGWSLEDALMIPLLPSTGRRKRHMTGEEARSLSCTEEESLNGDVYP